MMIRKSWFSLDFQFSINQYESNKMCGFLIIYLTKTKSNGSCRSDKSYYINVNTSLFTPYTYVNYMKYELFIHPILVDYCHIYIGQTIIC